MYRYKMENRCSVRDVYGYDWSGGRLHQQDDQHDERSLLSEDQESWLKSLVLLQSDIATRMHSDQQNQQKQNHDNDTDRDNDVVVVTKDLVKKLDPKILVHMS